MVQYKKIYLIPLFFLPVTDKKTCKMIYRSLLIMGILSSLFSFGGCTKSSPSSREQSGKVNVTAQLNHLLMPLDRGERYEDPLHKALCQKGLGEVDGGGTMQLQSGEIKYIDVEIILNNTTEGIPFVIEQLERLGAPKGSMLIIHDTEPSREIPIGKTEGVAVYLDGVNLPVEVYESSDINVVIKEFNKRLDGHGSVQGSWRGPTETALYLYGDDAEKIKELISDFLKTYPLCKGSRIVTIAP